MAKKREDKVLFIRVDEQLVKRVKYWAKKLKTSANKLCAYAIDQKLLELEKQDGKSPVQRGR